MLHHNIKKFALQLRIIKQYTIHTNRTTYNYYYVSNNGSII